MALRSYQYYAVEAISARVMAGRKNGYIWHTTESGKTLTSFKAAQFLIENPKVDKVVFVVDRADLDYQTTKGFNHCSDGSVDSTDNTRARGIAVGRHRRADQCTGAVSGGSALQRRDYQALHFFVERRVV
jgi:superfamily II DNA or RNA helicase